MCCSSSRKSCRVHQKPFADYNDATRHVEGKQHNDPLIKSVKPPAFQERIFMLRSTSFGSLPSKLLRNAINSRNKGPRPEAPLLHVARYNLRSLRERLDKDCQVLLHQLFICVQFKLARNNRIERIYRTASFPGDYRGAG